MRKLFAYILLLGLAGSSVEAATYTWYGSPFKVSGAYPSPLGLSSVNMAINDWWIRYQARWASAFPGCFYVHTDYGDGSETGVFAWVRLVGTCSGGVLVTGTRYTSDIPPDDPKGNGSSCLSSPNPIAYGNGNKWLVEEDIVANEGVLGFERAYNSNPVTIGGNFGARWRSDYGQQLVFARAGGAGKIWAYRPDGKVIKHTLTSGVYLPDADIADRLYADASSGGTYRLHTGDGMVERYDASGKLLEILDARGRKRTLTYSDGTAGVNGGYVLNASGVATTTVMPAGWLIRVSDDMGRSLRFGHDGSGRVVKVTDTTDGGFLYGYDANDNLATVTYPDGALKTYHYGESQYTGGISLPNALTGITDENDVRYVTYLYDSNGRAIDEVFPEVGVNTNRYQLAFDSNQTTVTDPLGTERVYAFQTILGVPRHIGTSQPGGSGCGAASSSLSYDANGNVVGRADFNGNVTTYSYDLTRNLETQRVEAAGFPEARTISTQWHDYWRVPTRIAEPKKQTVFVYNGDIDPETGGVLTCAPTTAVVPNSAGGSRPIGVLCKKVEQATSDANGSAGFTASVIGLPRVWQWTYGAYGQVLSEDGPRTDVADVTMYAYYDIADPNQNKRGRLSAVTNAVGHVTQITAWDGHGNPLAMTDPNGVVTTFAYDLRQRLLSQTTGAETTAYAWDDAGQLTKITLPDGSYFDYSYDLAHRLTGVADSLGNTLHYTLDVVGNRVLEEIKDSQGQVVQTRQREYDALNRLYRDIGAQNQAASYEYDANGNRTRYADPLNHIERSVYDGLNRQVQVTDPENGVTHKVWDGQDQLTQVVDPRNLATTYTLDGLGNLSQQTSPDTGITQTTHDAADNELSRTDAKGQSLVTEYDALNRPVQVSYPGGQILYAWDQGSNGKGHLTQIEEFAGGTLVGSELYSWDAQGRVNQKTRVTGAFTHTQSYAYTNGQLVGMTLPSGCQLAYARNGAGQVTRIELADTGGGAKVIARDISYHPFGEVKRWIDGAGQEHVRGQDQDGRVSGYSLGASSWLLGYDNANRVVGQMDGANPTDSGAYGYDNLGRLTNVQLPAAAYGYGYDANGNRTSQSAGSQTRSDTIGSANNHLQSLSNPAQIYTYDANGSVTSDGVNQYAYDGRGRLIGVVTPTESVSYHIDALGQRVRKTVTNNGVTVSDTFYHYDLEGRLIGESNATGSVAREYLWLDDLPLAVIETEANTDRIYTVHADHLNTPRVVTDAQNRIIWRNGPLAEPFGNALPEEDPDGDGRDFVLNLRFPGQYYDRETNTHYNYFRDYDPLTGRYLQSDPIGLNGGINTYAYANGNPLTYTDPEGLLSIAACSHPMNVAACAAAGIGVAASVVPKPGYVPAPMPIPKGKEQCQQPCPPCKLSDGTVVAIGTIGYRWDKLSSHIVQHGVAGDHLNLYTVNQNPNNCKCFWKPEAAVRPPPLPGWIPIQPLR